MNVNICNELNIKLQNQIPEKAQNKFCANAGRLWMQIEWGWYPGCAASAVAGCSVWAKHWSYKALELQSISELKSPLSYKFLHNATAPPGLNFQAAQSSLLAQFCIYLHSSLAFCTFWWISPGTGLIGANIVHPLFSHSVASNRTRLNIKMHSFQSSIGWSWTLPAENALSDEFPTASR